jgi:uncharacterized protein YecT (DUF1311 family)
MTTDPAGQRPGAAAATPRGPRAWPMSRTVAVGVIGAVVLGLLLGVWARPNLSRPSTAAPMRAVAVTEDAAPAKMAIEVNALPPAPIARSAGRLDVLPPGAVQVAPWPAPASETEPSAPLAAAPQIAAADGCQTAGSRAAQMVCADPELSAADRELNQAYRRALRSGVSPDQLRQDQRDWLAIREDAARRSPRAVASIYEQRIDELNQIADDGPG